VAVEACGAHELVDLTREQRKVVNGGGAHGGRQQRSELAFPASMACSSSSNLMLEEEVTMTTFPPGLDDVDGVRRWVMMASRDDGWRVKARAEQSEG
jgi:hypothetical protein